jgi:hypothetical protein
MTAVNAGQDDRTASVADVDSREPLFQQLLDTVRGGAGVSTGVVVGELVGFVGQDRAPLVCFASQPGADAIQARTVVHLRDADIGREVVLAFEGADVAKPIVMGALAVRRADGAAKTVEMEVDGERVLILAREQLILRCGRASITLTKAGKILIHGEYVSSRSNGTNRIRGGTVEIN